MMYIYLPPYTRPSGPSPPIRFLMRLLPVYYRKREGCISYIWNGVPERVNYSIRSLTNYVYITIYTSVSIYFCSNTYNSSEIFSYPCDKDQAKLILSSMIKKHICFSKQHLASSLGIWQTWENPLLQIPLSDHQLQEIQTLSHPCSCMSPQPLVNS